jgi:hypothetical protein
VFQLFIVAFFGTLREGVEMYNRRVQPRSIRLCRIRLLRTEAPKPVDEMGSLNKDEAHAAPTDIAWGKRFAGSAGHSVLRVMTPAMSYLVNSGVGNQFVSPV